MRDFKRTPSPRRRVACLVSTVVLALAGCVERGPSEGGESVKYLGIGNSFTWNSTTYLDEIAESEGRDLEFFVAGIGGSSMEEHVKRIRAFEADPSDPNGRPYARTIDGEERNYSLMEVLQQDEWDVVSIQQLSRLSFDFSTYEPFAGQLIEYIRKYAPQAEIVIHMTWAYRKDHDWYVNGELTQQTMFEGLSDAYRNLAETYDLRIVPIGAAIQEARSLDEWQFSFPDPEFDYDNPKYPNLPEQTGSLINGWVWRADKETGEQEFRGDLTHANEAGCYLGGLVHIEFLFGEPPSEEVFVPEGLSEDQADSLQQAAHTAIQTYRSFNDKVARNESVALR